MYKFTMEYYVFTLDTTCPVHEQWSECSNGGCRKKLCSERELPLFCTTISECVPGCLCEEGYLRNESGLCVPEEDCTASETKVKREATCPVHEVWSHCSNAECRAEYCTQRGLSVPCPAVSECVPGCLCQDGYLRDESGNCVPEEDCTASEKRLKREAICPLHEVWSQCSNAECRAEYCTQRGLPVVCPAVLECVPGCLCQDGYLRDESGLCVPEEDCTASEKRLKREAACPLHEVWSHCSNAECRAEYCIHRGLAVACPSVLECVPGCLCEDKYLRDESGLCVPQEDCPNNCGPNEVFECVNPCPLIQTCEDRALNITCSKNQECDYLCVCKEGYFRRFEGGECIPEVECGPRACGGNERYTHCKPSCSNDTCSSLASLRSCENQEPCKAGCICRDGYFREEEGSPCKPLCLCSEAQETHDCSAWLAEHEQEKSRREENNKEDERQK